MPLQYFLSKNPTWPATWQTGSEKFRNTEVKGLNFAVEWKVGGGDDSLILDRLRNQ